MALRPADPPPTSAPDDAPTVITPARPPDAANDPTLGLAVGSRLGGFQIVEAIGAGGMAAVLKAKDVDLGRVVALKILPPHMARDPENVARFKLEARAAAQLDHDNVARVFACGEDQRLNFIAFEFVEGETLRDLIDRRGQLPPAECVRYLAQVAAGLAHAADRGVVHRDVKPSNIIVTPDGRAKLVDMGLARSLAGGSVNGGVTQSGVTLGTFDYISPEQALDPRRADARSDVYSLGCTIYHALTGRPPVPAGTAARKLQAHQNDPPVDPRLLNPQVRTPWRWCWPSEASTSARRYRRRGSCWPRRPGWPPGWGCTRTLPADARGSSAHVPLPAGPAPRPSAGLVVGLGAVAVAGGGVRGGRRPRPRAGPGPRGPTRRPAHSAGPPADPNPARGPAARRPPAVSTVGDPGHPEGWPPPSRTRSCPRRPGRRPDDLTADRDGWWPRCGPSGRHRRPGPAADRGGGRHPGGRGQVGRPRHLRRSPSTPPP
ncbi:MAG: protein kinase [Gemmataceae bacterium]